MEAEQKVVPMNSRKSNPQRAYNLSDIPDRRLTQDTCRTYGVGVSREGSMVAGHRYKYFDKEGNHLASKFREVKTKDFWSEGDLSSCGLFGQNVFGQNLFWPNNFLAKNIFWPKKFLAKKLFGQKHFWPTNFLAKKVFGQKSFWPKNLLAKNFFGQTIFWPKNCLAKFFFGN